MIFNCCCLCYQLIFPNTFNVSEISKGIKNKLYKDYFCKFYTKNFSLDLICFKEEYKKDDKNDKIEKILIQKILKEINKLDISKYRFWNNQSISFVVEQISYYIFSLLIDADSLFEIKELNNGEFIKSIKFDFLYEKMVNFKQTFFSGISLNTEEDKNIHKSLNIKLTNEIRNIIENIDFSIIIPLIINSYIEIENNEEKIKIEKFSEII